MKKRIFCGAMAAAMAVSMAGCAAQSSEASSSVSSSEAAAAQAVAGSSYTGTVTAVSAAALTITTESDGELTIPLSDSTAYTRGGMGGEAPGGSGQAPADLPDGEGSTDSEVPEKPDGTGQAPTDGGSAPEKPDGGTASEDSTPPALPDGSAPSGSGSTDGEAPEKPDGDAPSGESAPGGMEETLSYESIAVGDTVTVTVGSDGAAETVALSGGMGGSAMGGGSSQPESYEAAYSFAEDTATSGEAYASSGTDENSVLVSNGASVTLDGASITRNSSDSTGGDASSFYGVGAAALVTDGTLTISNSSITTDAKGGAGVFAYGDGTAYVSDSVISTAQDTSGGIHVAGGGTLYAWDLNVETDGSSSAAIRSDRGSGTMVVDGGSYTSNGSGSPAVYSTADITIHNAALTATGSEAVCIEGLNTIRLFDCDLSGDMPENEQNDCIWNVILYQSMSGDSEVGNSTFEMIGGSLTASSGGMFYTTNTESTFLISGVDITPSDSNDFFLKCTGNSNTRGWGQTGANGADCTFTAREQTMEGDVIWDSISELDFYVLDSSTLTGAVLDDESNAGSGGSGYAALFLDSSSTWVVTADSTLTELHSAGSIVDENGSTVTIVGTDGTVYVQGNSSVTVTVSSYDTSVDTSGASTVDSFSDYEVSRA